MLANHISPKEFSNFSHSYFIYIYLYYSIIIVRFGDQKVILVKGHFYGDLPLCSRDEPVFVAWCTPLGMPENREIVVQVYILRVTDNIKRQTDQNDSK